MTTTTFVPTTTAAQDVTDARARPVTFARVLNSEWIKLRTLRSTWWGMVSIVVVLAGFGALAAAVSSGSVANPDAGGGGGFGGDDPLSTVLIGANFAVLLVGVLGCLAGAREHGSRMITMTMAAIPRRWPVVVAKAAVLGVVVLPVVLIGVFGAFGIGMSLLSAGDAATVSLSDDGVLRSLVGMAGYLTAIALLSLGLGMLMRNVAASIGTVIGGVLFLPTLAGALLPNSWDGLLQVLPSNAAAAFTAVEASTDQVFGVIAGAAAITAWVVAVLAGAVVSTLRRDV